MRIEFEALPNNQLLFINTATFHLPSGKTMTLDRDVTEFFSTDEKMIVLWKDVYLWAGART